MEPIDSQAEYTFNMWGDFRYWKPEEYSVFMVGFMLAGNSNAGRNYPPSHSELTDFAFAFRRAYLRWQERQAAMNATAEAAKKPEQEQNWQQNAAYYQKLWEDSQKRVKELEHQIAEHRCL